MGFRTSICLSSCRNLLRSYFTWYLKSRRTFRNKPKGVWMICFRIWTTSWRKESIGRTCWKATRTFWTFYSVRTGTTETSGITGKKTTRKSSSSPSTTSISTFLSTTNSPKPPRNCRSASWAVPLLGKGTIPPTESTSISFKSSSSTDSSSFST